VHDSAGRKVTDRALTVRIWADSHGRRYLLGSASVRGGVALITRLKLPAILHGKTITVQAFASGRHYVMSRSSVRIAKVK
jgi:hypothetical protein